jgi:apolipoprotein N-acyltransferase
LALATFRAVEQRRFLARSTNTGISAFVDPAGRIVSQTPTFKRANLMEELTPLTGTTLYQRLGDWPGMLSILMVLGLVFLYKPKD